MNAVLIVVIVIFLLLAIVIAGIAIVMTLKNKVKVGELNKDKEVLQERLIQQEEANYKIAAQLDDQKRKYDKLQNFKKSAEVRMGQISENLAPFLDDFPYDPKACHFLGAPIDYIVFDYVNGRIVFLEVKSGNSNLTSNQRKVRDIIKKGTIEWDVYRIGGSSNGNGEK